MKDFGHLKMYTEEQSTLSNIELSRSYLHSSIRAPHNENYKYCTNKAT